MDSTMKKTIMQVLMAAIAVALNSSVVAQGGSSASPTDPVEAAKFARAKELIRQARELVTAGNDELAELKLGEAAVVEASIRYGAPAYAKYCLAKIHLKRNRIPDALEAYKATFSWNPSARYGKVWQGDLDTWSGAGIQAALEYAVLLGRQGHAEDAKAMYYFALRAYMLDEKSRLMEPAPFLVVFDQDPEGIAWQYSPERLEAAACMLQAMLSSGTTDFATNVRTTSAQFVQRARTLAPDWFYPVLFMANNAQNGSEREQQLLAEAESLARPGLERQLVEGFRQRLADWREHCEQNNIAWKMANDMRPLTEGAERRKRMQCLRPNEQILRRLSIERPQ
jgi:tetratricopeptide (TPR) repeat protein